VHKHDGELVGKKQDKLGRWRTAKVPDYANDPVQAYAIASACSSTDARREYLKELAGIIKAKNLPASGPLLSSGAERCSTKRSPSEGST
jgi:hypothetical protein